VGVNLKAWPPAASGSICVRRSQGWGWGRRGSSISLGQQRLCRGGTRSLGSRGSAGRGGVVPAQLQAFGQAAATFSSLNTAPELPVQPPCLTLWDLFAFQHPENPCQTNHHNKAIAKKLPDDAKQDTAVDDSGMEGVRPCLPAQATASPPPGLCSDLTRDVLKNCHGCPQLPGLPDNRRWLSLGGRRVSRILLTCAAPVC